MPSIKFLKKLLEQFSRDKGSQLAAALAYTGVFALAPMFIVIISTAGLLFGKKAVEGQLFSSLSDIMGPKTAETLQHAIAHAQQSGHSTLALVVGLIGSLLAAGALTGQLQTAFDQVFAVVPDPRGGIKHMVYVKLKNAVLLIVGSLVVAASVAATAILAAVGTSLSTRLGMPKATLQIINLLVSFTIFVGVLYLVYRVLPDIRMPKKIVFWTAVATGVLFLIGKIILGWVIGHNGTASAYGAAASVITLLLWFYYTGQILIIGAEGMKVYADTHGIIYQPKSYTLKQKTVNIQAKNNIFGLAIEKFARGFSGKIRKQ